MYKILICNFTCRILKNLKIANKDIKLLIAV